MMKRIALSLLAIAWQRRRRRMGPNIFRALICTSPTRARRRSAAPRRASKSRPSLTQALIVDPPLPDLLDQGVVWIQWRAENVHIVPVFGKGALNASPRLGHLHVHVDDLPWWWADPSDINTIDVAGMPPGRTRYGSN